MRLLWAPLLLMSAVRVAADEYMLSLPSPIEPVAPCWTSMDCAFGYYCDSGSNDGQSSCWECDAISATWGDAVGVRNPSDPHEQACSTDEFLAHCPRSEYSGVQARYRNTGFASTAESAASDSPHVSHDSLQRLAAQCVASPSSNCHSRPLTDRPSCICRREAGLLAWF